MSYLPGELPITELAQWETRAVLKKTAEAHRYLGELKGITNSFDDPVILIHLFTLIEAQNSSQGDNLVIDQEALFEANLFDVGANARTKIYPTVSIQNIKNYALALKEGCERVKSQKKIRLSDIVQIQQSLRLHHAASDKAQNSTNMSKISVPANDVAALMGNLITYIKDDTLCDADPLIKMAIIHHQFLCLHPFSDENERTARILTLLYISACDLMTLPVLHLSVFLRLHQRHYYLHKEQVKETGNWEPWLLYMVDGIVQTAKSSLRVVIEIKKLMLSCKQEILQILPKIYSHNLVLNLFKHPYTTIDFVIHDLSVSRLTASKYLEALVKLGMLKKEKVGRNNYYINHKLCDLLKQLA